MMKYIKYILFLSLLSCFISCVSDEFTSNPSTLKEGYKSIDINIDVVNQRSNNTHQVEAGDYYNNKLNENKIDKGIFNVFIFDAEGNLDLYLNNNSKELRLADNNLSLIINPERAFRYEGEVYTIVVIANTDEPINNIKTKKELENYRVSNSSLNTNTPQSMFLMDGEIKTGRILWNENSRYPVGSTLSLKRAAAKIRLRIKEIEITETENGQHVVYNMVGMPEVKFMNYANTTTIIQGHPYIHTAEELESTDYLEMKRMPFAQKMKGQDKEQSTLYYISSEVPFYSYERDWGKSRKEPPYLQVKINLKADNKEAKPFFYRIPINYQQPLPGMSNEQKKELYQMKRNYLYDIVSNIHVLGSENENNPTDIEATIGVQPWDEIISIPGDLQSAHYLVVKDKLPIMANIRETKVEYVSDLPIEEPQIIKTWYEYFEDGMNIRIENHGDRYEKYIQNTLKETMGSDGFYPIQLRNNTSNPTKTTIEIESPIPSNYLPIYIEFEVKQQKTGLTEKVIVTQYPPKYVTGEKSPGFKGGTSEPQADFRYHNPLGSGGQINDVLFQITTVVNQSGEFIGDPTDQHGKTKKDRFSNRLISPQFIIASQHGMTSSQTLQYPLREENFNPEFPLMSWNTQVPYTPGFGPYSNQYNQKLAPYIDGGQWYSPGYTNYQPKYNHYYNAEEFCENYFEGEYGMDGEYEENLIINDYGYPKFHKRLVKKTFRYQGRWRIPTAAELEYIDAIQKDENSDIKKLLQGREYWTAEKGKAYYFSAPYASSDNIIETNKAVVRCVFDTYKISNHP